MESPGTDRNSGFSAQADTYLRRVLLDRIYTNDDVLFTKTFQPPKGEGAELRNRFKDGGKIPKISSQIGGDVPTLTRANRPFLILLRFFGCIPYGVDSRGELSLPKQWLVYSIVAYALYMYLIYLQIPIILQMTGTLDSTVSALSYAMALVKVVLVPLIMWLPFKRVSIYFKNLHKFHCSFYRLTGEVMVFDIEKYTPYIAIGIPIFSGLIVLYWYFSTQLLKEQAPLFFVPYVLTLGLDFFWCTPLVVMGKAAEKLVASLKKKFEMNGKDPIMQEYLLREYRALWLDLSKCLQCNNDVSTMTFTYHALHVFLMLTLNLYSLLNGLRSSWEIFQTLRLISVTIFLVELWLMANAAHYCTTKFEDIQWDPFFLIPSIETAEPVRREMSTFLDVAVAAPHIVDIGGFVCINRSWLTNMLGNLLSGLIILLQFRVQQTDDVLAANNTAIASNQTALPTTIKS